MPTKISKACCYGSDQTYSSIHTWAWTFDVIDSGPIDGPLVVLLHGFPETAHSWEQTSELLHEHQFRTFAIHQRGYSLNARPQSRFHYALSELTEDVVVFIKDLVNQFI